jgi:predicted O-methyltransferase YrrM
MNLFTQIEETTGAITGWCSLEKAFTLAAIVMASRPKLCVEIGVWAGKSLVPVALACREIGYGRVIAIDPWKAEASVEGQLHPADREWWSNQAHHDLIFDQFNQTLATLKLRNIVEIVRATSEEATVPIGIGLLSLDGNHADQAIRDVERYAPNIIPGGYLVADDLGWTGGGVGRAIEKLPAMGFVELFRQTQGDQWAVFQKVR